MRLEVGETIQVAEEDYLIGTGVLRLRITEVLGVENLHGALWRRIRGFEICWNGTVARMDREALIRIAPVPPQRSPNGKAARTG